MNRFIALFLLVAFILQLSVTVAHDHGHGNLLKRSTHATSKVKAAATATKKAAAATSKPPASSVPASSAPAASSTAAAAAPVALKPLAVAVLSADCSTCGWLIQQVSPCVSSGSSVQKCMCSQQNINAYASCMLCAGTVTMGSTPQVALNDLVSGCSSGGYSVSAAVSNITSTSKFGSSNGTSNSSSSGNGTSTSSTSSGSHVSYSPYSFLIAGTSLVAVFIGSLL